VNAFFIVECSIYWHITIRACRRCGISITSAGTAADKNCLLKLRFDAQSCLSCPDRSWALQNRRLNFRPATLAANPMLAAVNLI